MVINFSERIYHRKLSHFPMLCMKKKNIVDKKIRVCCKINDIVLKILSAIKHFRFLINSRANVIKGFRDKEFLFYSCPTKKIYLLFVIQKKYAFTYLHAIFYLQHYNMQIMFLESNRNDKESYKG